MSSYIQLYQIEGGQALEKKVGSIENMLENGNFTVNEMNATNGVIQNNLMVGYTHNTDLCDNLVMDVSGSTLFHNQVQILGDTIFGEKSSNAEDVSNNDTNLFVYGDLRIMDGGNIIIQDVCNTTITDLRTEVKITDSLDISNDGTSVAMTVRQIETATRYDIAHFVDGDDEVFTIGAGGKTYIGGDVSMDSSLEVSNNLIVHTDLFVDKDVSFGGHLQVVSDVSMESSLEISNNLIVHNEMFVDEDVSFGENLTVIGDVFIKSVLDICGTITTNKNFIFETNSTEKMIIDTSGMKILNSDPSYSALDISATSALKIPVGYQSQRPTVETTGQMRYNKSTKQFEGYGDTGKWQGLGGIIDVDQDTFILAETNPDADNDEIQIFTAGSERMKVDACGNIQMINSDPTYSALDVSATSAIKIPVGTNTERPSIQSPGQIRYNTSTKQFEGYGESGTWQGLGGIIDVDQDTFILAETNPDVDNDEIQIFTAGSERMKVDAGGNIQMTNSNSSYSALDISATSALLIPGGTKDERPTNSENPRALRFNSDTSLCEVYTESNIWSGIPVYKAEQPPALLDISQVRLSETVTVNWEKFADIYKDVFDGKCYPIYLQTFVDISFSDISGQSSGGWETIIIGAGNYDETGTTTTPDTSFVFNSVVSTYYNNSTGYTIDFTDKPRDTTNLPVFTQDDSFDLRIYGVNKSGTSPNYNYIYNVQLKQTGAPGEVDVILFDSFGKTDFDVDLSFALDSNDTSITSGISIVNYDVSFTLSGTKSLEDRGHSGNQETSWANATSLSKSNLNVSGLFPGAQYDIQVRAQNALKFDSNGEYMDGSYGDVFTSSGLFTNNSGDTTGKSTTQYIEYSSSGSDLKTVSHNALQFSLEKGASINCYVNGTNNESNRTISNSNSYIDITGTSKFYVNYGLQGTDMSGVDNLVQVTVDLEICGNSVSSQTITYNGTNEPSAVSADTIDISNGGSTFYQFSSATGYTDEYTTDNYNNGFVYSSTFSRTDSNDLSSVFVDNFPASTDYYNLSYIISSQTNNKNKQIDDNGNASTSDNTGNFYVDDYLSTPTITWTQDPYISVTGSTTLFGIPSVSSLNLDYKFNISNFANYIIPTNNNVHSYVAINDKNSYSIAQQNKTNVYEDTSYNITNITSISMTTGRTFDSDTSSNLTIRVYYLDNTSGKPSITDKDYTTNSITNIGHIFKDVTTSYNTYTLYSFDSVNSVIGSEITPSFSSPPSDISDILLYFDQKFVSSGYYVDTDGTNVYPFSDWSDGYAVTGLDYTNYVNTGSVGSDGSTKFKWIVLDVTNNVSGSELNLTNFKIQNQLFTSKTFGTDYEAYVMDENNKIGSLKEQTYETGAAGGNTWFQFNNYTIADANNQANGLRIGSSTSPAAYVAGITSTSQKLYLIVGLPPNSSSINYFTYSS